MGKRVLFYSHDGFGLGHNRRNFLLARALHEAVPVEILLVTGSPFPQEPSLDEGIDYVRLPALFRVGNNEWVPKHLSQLSIEQLISLRADIILSVMRNFKPDLLVSDHIPQGAGGELLPSLEWMKERGGRAVAGFRDILDSASRIRRNWHSDATVPVLADYYSRILVYGTPDVCDFRDYGIPDSVMAKLSYCGYMGRPQPEQVAVEAARRDLRAGRKRAILVCPGGGADGFHALETCVRAGAELERELDARVVVVTGPLMPASDRERLEELAAPSGVEIRRLLDSLPTYVAAADLMIGMCGYNTVCETLSFGVPLTAIPREEPSFEQLLRARAFAGLGLLRFVQQASLDADSLLEAALASATEDHPSPKVPMDGVDRACGELLEAM